MLDQTVQSDALEPSQCSDCPFFTQSTRSPSCGFCKLYDETVLGKDKPGNLCITEFWNLAHSTAPTHDYQPKITVIEGKGSRPTTASLAMRNGKKLVLSIS